MSFYILRFFISFVALASLSLTTYCGCSKQVYTEMRRTIPKSWAYWIQGPDLSVLAESGCDIVVIDYSSDGRDSGAFTKGELEALQGKTVLAYLSIGEAEDYRFYWNPGWEKSPPPFLGPENPDWPGNYKVRYWDGLWWETAIEPYLDRIIAAGFDGVYLDIIDAYWFWHEEGRDLTVAADEMVGLVERIESHLRRRGGKQFLIAPQNGLSILEDASSGPARRYLELSDMFGEENLFFNTYSAEDQQYRLDLVRRAIASGRPVLNVEYITEDKIGAYRKKARGYPGLLPFAASEDAQLDGLPYPCMKSGE